MDKISVIKNYCLTKRQTSLIEVYLGELKNINKKLNLVGSSTLNQPWDRHINDSLQLSIFISNKKATIIDLGTGAGLPGLILGICGFNNVLLVDSKMKKINFIKDFIKQNKLPIKTMCSRVENIKNLKFDFIISRAFAPLYKNLHYSLKISKKNTSLLFLKGRSVKKEIKDAKKQYNFNYNLFESKSIGGGFVLNINKFNRI